MLLRRNTVKDRLDETSFHEIGAVLPLWRWNDRPAKDLVPLPVEFDASRQARAELLKLSILRNQEVAVVGKVSNVAAMSYVVAMVGAELPQLHLILMARGNDRD